MDSLRHVDAEALSVYLFTVASRPYELGKMDCVRFVADCLRIGYDLHYHEFLGYNDRQSALRRLREAGGLKKAIESVLDREVPACDLHPGDVAWLPNNRHGVIGFIMPGQVLVKADCRIDRFDIHSVQSGWRTWADS